jgi:imidazolonepropionase-like amidohydrolase
LAVFCGLLRFQYLWCEELIACTAFLEENCVMHRLICSAAFAALAPATLAAQQTSSAAAALSQQVRERYVSVTEPVVALTHVTLIDGTGSAPKPDQTVVIRDGTIAEVGAANRVKVPAGARTIELRGHTVIPGLIGMHDHLYYTAAGGRRAQLSFTGPRLYLGTGVTTIRTTGSSSPYSDINTKAAIDAGRIPGPRVHITAPYITGVGGGGQMAVLETPEAARRFVAYWAQEGATWLKAYTDIKQAELKAAIDEAHKRGVKVTGHLCSVSFQEAVDLGIDNLEHGLLTATDFDPQKQVDMCPQGSMVRVGTASPTSDAWRATIKKMVDKKVGMTSTLAVYEPFFPKRPTDERGLEAMSPEVREAYQRFKLQIDTSTSWALTPEMLQRAMAFEKAFVEAGGLLAAGVDPTGFGGALPGFGDQRNYELLVEAGFSPAQTVQIMSANGAKILGVYDRLGSVERGKIADLVVMQGDLAADPTVIRKVTTVFKDGVGYDSAKMIAAVKGRVGID